MIDFHTHILPEIDDGSRNMDMSLNMLIESCSQGVEYICATPHFIVGEYEISREAYEYKLDLLRANSNCNSQILSGLEIYINPELPQLYRDKRIWGLNGSSYMLIELPMQHFPIYTEKVLYQLRLEGITPIIAHPERNLNIIKDLSLLVNLIEQGNLVQMNAGSVLGMHGKLVQKFAEELIRRNMVHFLGSDMHNDTTRPPVLKMGYDKLSGINNELYIWMQNNEKKIIDNDEIEAKNIKNIKRKKHHIFNLFRK
jgi:protein-tyrosine phosphatase